MNNRTETIVIFQFIFGLEHYVCDREILLTRFGNVGIGLHHVLMLLSFQSALGGYCNLMRPRKHSAMTFNSIYFLRKWKDKINMMAFFLSDLLEKC